MDNAKDSLISALSTSAWPAASTLLTSLPPAAAQSSLLNRNSTGQTALHIAAELNAPVTLLKLMVNTCEGDGGKLLAMKDDEDMTAKDCAVDNDGDCDAIDLLGMDYEEIKALPANDGEIREALCARRPLWRLGELQQWDTMSERLYNDPNYAQIAGTDGHLRNAFHYVCAGGGPVTLLRLMLSLTENHDTQLAGAKDAEGFSALHFLCVSRETTVLAVKIVVDASPAMLDEEEAESGETALDWATECGLSEQVCDMLEFMNADDIFNCDLTSESITEGILKAKKKVEESINSILEIKNNLTHYYAITSHARGDDPMRRGSVMATPREGALEMEVKKLREEQGKMKGKEETRRSSLAIPAMQAQKGANGEREAELVEEVRQLQEEKKEGDAAKARLQAEIDDLKAEVKRLRQQARPGGALPPPPPPPPPGEGGGEACYTHEQLKAGVEGIVNSEKEKYLSNAEFVKVFGVDRGAFLLWPKWKKKDMKKKVGLF